MNKPRSEPSAKDKARGYAIRNEDTEIEVRECLKNPAHIWMAKLPYCPYCHISPEARARWAQENW